MQAAQAAFSHPRGLYWKMSIDLTRALVPSMGAHDPLEGLIEAVSLGLEREAHQLAGLCANRPWVTDDPLGAGALLVGALRLERLVADGRPALALGLQAVARMGGEMKDLKPLVPMADDLAAFWLAPANQASPAWSEHGDISAVMLAACLAPEGVLGRA
jgi:hypothetical protein